MGRKILAAIIVLMLLTTIAVVLIPKASAQEIPYGPYVDELVYMVEEDESKAVRMVDKKELDIYLWPMRTVEDKKFAEESPNIETVKAYSGIFNLFINPVETDPETVGFNPFSIREVREALNYYIDREFIVKEIMGGFGKPQVTMWWCMSPEYGRLYSFIMEYEKKYSYNPDLGKSIIFDALYKAGAEYKDGKWYYNDKPITVKVFIRVEDVRKQIGDYIASKLEELGFTVERVYGPAAKAWEVVYGGDPTRGEWHVYTEGWATTTIEAYEDWIPYYMYTSPWTGTVFEIYRPSPELVELATKLNEAKYKSLEERFEWCKKLTDLCLKDSTRLWLVTEASVFVHHKDVGNIASDLQAGFYGYFTLRTIKFKDRIGGSVKVGQKTMFVSAFNPVGGVKWLYEEVIRMAFSDFGMYPHPHTGRYIPVRAEFEVETAGPEGKLTVPADAIKFDPATRSWVPVGSDVSATSKVTFKYTFGKWHHGEDMTMADILMNVAEMFRISNPDDPLYDPASVTPSVEVFVSKFKGLKIEGPDTVTVYIDYWHPDETFIAAQADIWGTGATIPWEVYAIMNAAVENRELAFSDTRAEEWGVEWLDLAKGPSIPILATHLDELSAINFIPPEISAYVTVDEASARWDALRSWYDERSHFYVSNGPYYLERVDPVARMFVLKAFRQYPFKADHWDHLVTPKIPDVLIPSIPDVIPGLEMTVDLSVTVAGEPYSNVDITAMVIDPTGKLIIKVPAEMVEVGKFRITLEPEDTAKLAPGVYTLLILAVGKEAAIPKTYTKPFTVIPELAYFQILIKDVETKLKSDIDKMKSDVDELSSKTDELSDKIARLSGQISMLMALATVAIILSIIGIVVGVIAIRKTAKS